MGVQPQFLSGINNAFYLSDTGQARSSSTNTVITHCQSPDFPGPPSPTKRNLKSSLFSWLFVCSCVLFYVCCQIRNVPIFNQT